MIKYLLYKVLINLMKYGFIQKVYKFLMTICYKDNISFLKNYIKFILMKMENYQDMNKDLLNHIFKQIIKKKHYMVKWI